MVLGVGLIALGFVVIAGTNSNSSEDLVGGAGVLLAAAALGAAFRYRVREREHLVEQAKLREREALARELHDTVAHHVSAIAVSAQAGLVHARSSAPGGATEALEAIEALQVIEREAARTLAEMRVIVSALRHPQSVAPGGGLADITRLASESEALRVDVELCGELTDLSPALEAALYRVAQESVTNARRHAEHATRVAVTVRGSATDVRLTISDDGSATPAPPGYGLVGMSERVSLLGGTLDAGPAPDHGWLVRAVLPRSRNVP
jgi:signal transduction histidine kinase